MNHQWDKVNLITQPDSTDLYLYKCKFCEKEQRIATCLGSPPSEDCKGSCKICKWWHSKSSAKQRKTCYEQGYKANHHCSQFEMLSTIFEQLLIDTEELASEGELLVCCNCSGLRWQEEEKEAAARCGQVPGDFLQVYRKSQGLFHIHGSQMKLGTVVEGKMYCFRCRPCR